VFRSDNGGATWTRVNSERKLRQRAWYYSRIYADSRDPNVVWASNVSFQKSVDGGRTWTNTNAPHGDSHDFWIAPDDNKRMIEANDGGANVSRDGGRTWTRQDYLTAQFYHVTTTNDFPYRICGAQQDNSTVCGTSRPGGGMDGPVSNDGNAAWYDVGGCESGYIAVRPDDPHVVYAGCYGGYLSRTDIRTGVQRDISPWPMNPMGHSAINLKYRPQWTYPIVVSPHDPKVLYVGSNVLFRTDNDGDAITVADQIDLITANASFFSFDDDGPTLTVTAATGQDLAGLTLGRPDPLGLMRSLRRFTLPAHVIALPRRYRLPELVLPGARKFQQGGVSLATSVGDSEEFVSLRDYRPGDPLQRIHWKSFARTGKPIVKEYQDEFFERHALVLDTGRAAGEDPVFEDAVALAASFVYTIDTQECLLDLLFVADEVHQYTAGRGQMRADHMLEILAGVAPRPRASFEALARAVLAQRSRLSSCIVVCVDWDAARAGLLRTLAASGMEVRTLLVCAENTVPPDLPQGVLALHPGRIEEGLARLR